MPSLAWIAAASACAAVVAAPPLPARAHDAPSGWTYDHICCSSVDCRPVPAASVTPTRAGWRIVTTGEVVAYPLTRRSRDGSFHRCSVGGLERGKTICLYAPDLTQ